MSWLVLAGALAFGAQPPLVFSASTELVHVTLSVTDATGRPVRGLKPGDFTVSEDGKSREIATAVECASASAEGLAPCPVDFVLLLDTSTTMRSDLIRARDAAVRFANSIPAIRGRTIVSFNSRIQTWPFDQAGPAAILDRILAQNDQRHAPLRCHPRKHSPRGERSHAAADHCRVDRWRRYGSPGSIEAPERSHRVSSRDRRFGGSRQAAEPSGPRNHGRPA